MNKLYGEQKGWTKIIEKRKKEGRKKTGQDKKTEDKEITIQTTNDSLHNILETKNL